MKTSRLFLVGIALPLLFLFAFTMGTAQAKKKKGDEDGSQSDPRTLVQSVDATAGTITIQYMDTKKTHTYAIDGGTLVTVNGKSGAITSISPGMQVRDSVERNTQVLDSITVTAAAPPPSGAKKSDP
jgi:hypothetical protein